VRLPVWLLFGYDPEQDEVTAVVDSGMIDPRSREAYPTGSVLPYDAKQARPQL